MKQMTRQEIVDLIRSSNGRWIRITFIKRSTGETRVLVGRTGVKAHLRGGAPAYDFNEKGLISIWDAQKQAYRSVPMEGIISVAFAGEESVVA